MVAFGPRVAHNQPIIPTNASTQIAAATRMNGLRFPGAGESAGTGASLGPTTSFGASGALASLTAGGGVGCFCGLAGSGGAVVTGSGKSSRFHKSQNWL